MSDTYEAFYNGKPLNPNRGLPTMSYAQAEDCGLTDSERLWCRTDGQNNDFMPLKMESGVVSITCTQANYNFNEDITFTVNFTNVPQVMVCIDGDGTVGGSTVSCRNITSTGVRVSAQTTLTSSPTIKVKWLAIGT